MTREIDQLAGRRLQGLETAREDDFLEAVHHLIQEEPAATRRDKRLRRENLTVI